MSEHLTWLSHKENFMTFTALESRNSVGPLHNIDEADIERESSENDHLRHILLAGITTFFWWLESNDAPLLTTLLIFLPLQSGRLVKALK